MLSLHESPSTLQNGNQRTVYDASKRNYIPAKWWSLLLLEFQKPLLWFKSFRDLHAFTSIQGKNISSQYYNMYCNVIYYQCLLQYSLHDSREHILVKILWNYSLNQTLNSESLENTIILKTTLPITMIFYFELCIYISPPFLTWLFLFLSVFSVKKIR